jgi:hypothetical protein
MPVRVLSAIALATGFLLAAGCGPAKLNESHSYEIEPGDAKGFECPAQPKPQKIIIDFTSSPEDVTVLLFKAAEVKDSEMPDTPEAKALGKQTGKSGTLTVDVPENTATMFVVRGAKHPTKVDVKVSNK